MNIQLQRNNFLTGNKNIFQNGGLKSTQEKMERQAKRDGQIAFLENQKDNLKNMKGDSLEEISRKLEMLHFYEDRIAAAKQEYNNSQMFHVMEEAKEHGEKIAKAAEKYEPKTPEERLEELAEEARGTDESKGMLTETMEELEELTEEITEEMAEELTEEMTEETTGEMTELTEKLLQEKLTEDEKDFYKMYKGLDIRI